MIKQWFWENGQREATVHVMNRTPTVVVHDVIPKEIFTCKKLNLSHLKLFRYIVYVDVLDELKPKLEPKPKKCVFIGYCLEQTR